MFDLVTGGSGSGKSQYAEQLICRYQKEAGTDELIYIATMFPYGEETAKKISSHQAMRAGKGFRTIECYTDLRNAALTLARQDQKPCVLLECISNLTANELYMDDGHQDRAAEVVVEGVAKLIESCVHVVVVTNEVSSDHIPISEEMEHYRQVLGEINCRLAQMADQVTEVVYGIPVEVKR